MNIIANMQNAGMWLAEIKTLDAMWVLFTVCDVWSHFPVVRCQQGYQVKGFVQLPR
jgi:hypothetical protein